MNALYHPRPERWPQWSLKGLLIAVTLAALLVPWVVDAWLHEPPLQRVHPSQRFHGKHDAPLPTDSPYEEAP